MSRSLNSVRKLAADQAGKAQLELEFAAGKNRPEETQTVPVDGKSVVSAEAEGKTLTLVLASTIVNKVGGNAFPFVSKVDKHVVFQLTRTEADKLLEQSGEAGKLLVGKPVTMVVIYAYGDYRSATAATRRRQGRSGDRRQPRSCLPSSAVEGFITRNPFGDLAASMKSPLKIENALITPVPSPTSGWITAVFVFCYMALYAIGPGVCVWLALSELMPTRIRSNGMSVALLLNTAVSTTIAAIFLPTVGRYGYANMFFAFAAFTIIYFITATFFLPETKGKTLEEIEELFSGHAKGKS